MNDSIRTYTAVSLAVLVTVSVLGVAMLGVAAQTDGMSLSQDTYTQERGDVFEITVQLTDRKTGYIEIGSREANYLVMAQFTDVDEDGEVTVTVNSYYALENRANGGVGVVGPDRVRILNRALPSQTRPEVLSGSFDVQIGTDYVPTRGVAEVQDSATIRTVDRQTTALRSWSGAGQRIDFDTRDEFLEQFNITNFRDFVGQTERIAKSDFLVLELQASGLFGYVQTRNDLTGVGPRGEPTGVFLTVESVPMASGDPARRVDLTDRDNVLLTDPANNTMFLVLTTDVEAFEPGRVYRAQFEINETNRLVEDTSPDTEFQRLRREVFIVDRSLTFDNVLDGDEVDVTSDGTVSLSGTTTAARGTRVTMRVQSTDEGPALNTSETVTVGPDQTFEAALSMPEVTEPRNVSVTAQDAFGTLGSVNVTLVPSAEPPTTTPGETTTSPTTETTTTETTTTTAQERPTTTGGMMTETSTTTAAETTSPGTPGFTIVGVVFALLVAGLLAYRRRGR